MEFGAFRHDGPLPSTRSVHRRSIEIASEFLGLLAGKYIGKGDDFGPGRELAQLHVRSWA